MVLGPFEKFDKSCTGPPIKVTAEQKSWFLQKKCHRNGKNRNPEDSCRNYQESRGIGIKT
jgi:hypothetical protein